MESLGAFEAKTRLSELLDRASRGETFLITKHGRAVARLVPESSDPRRVAEATARLKRFRGFLAGSSLDEILSDRHRDHRY